MAQPEYYPPATVWREATLRASAIPTPWCQRNSTPGANAIVPRGERIPPRVPAQPTPRGQRKASSRANGVPNHQLTIKNHQGNRQRVPPLKFASQNRTDSRDR